ncbi:unnamed protein product [Hymenolepis diminuta]|uniref:Uncharacterized protein n=1 Tax=Hymenolepis diminuta TaxID=6216 RepID=A0A0R3S8F9_HYMDI|nr:unnamed protein product [Hymenolepis diminuta]
MEPADLICEKTINKLGSVVGDISLFNLTIHEDEIVHHHVGKVNRLCTSFRIGYLEENQFGCLIFILCLRSPCYAEVRLRLLSLLGREPNVKMSRCLLESATGPLTESVQPERT